MTVKSAVFRYQLLLEFMKWHNNIIKGVFFAYRILVAVLLKSADMSRTTSSFAAAMLIFHLHRKVLKITSFNWRA